MLFFAYLAVLLSLASGVLALLTNQRLLIISSNLPANTASKIIR